MKIITGILAILAVGLLLFSGLFSGTHSLISPLDSQFNSQLGGYINGTSTKTVLYPSGGGLGTSQIPLPGQVPIGNSSGTYTPGGGDIKITGSPASFIQLGNGGQDAFIQTNYGLANSGINAIWLGLSSTTAPNFQNSTFIELSNDNLAVAGLDTTGLFENNPRGGKYYWMGGGNNLTGNQIMTLDQNGNLTVSGNVSAANLGNPMVIQDSGGNISIWAKTPPNVTMESTNGSINFNFGQGYPAGIAIATSTGDFIFGVNNDYLDSYNNGISGGYFDFNAPSRTLNLYGILNGGVQPVSIFQARLDTGATSWATTEGNLALGGTASSSLFSVQNGIATFNTIQTIASSSITMIIYQGGYLDSATYYFKVTSIDEAGNESLPSDEFSTTTVAGQYIIMTIPCNHQDYAHRIYISTSSQQENSYINAAQCANGSSATTIGWVGPLTLTPGTPPTATPSAIFNGYVGIGTSTPTVSLDIEGSSSSIKVGCLEMLDKSTTTPVYDYVYASSSALVVSQVKPSFCQ